MRIGIDLGGTKIEIIVLDTSGMEVYRERIATPQGDYHATLYAIRGLIDMAKKHLSLTNEQVKIGIGTPGSLTPTVGAKAGLLRNSNSVCLNDKPFKDDLQKLLKREIAIANDANCLALSEAVDGSAKGEKSVFAVILGTGAGGGIVIDGKLQTGANAIAGEWGHNPLPWPTNDELPGLACYCGQNGCL